MSKHLRSLTQQVNSLEKQIMLRHQSIQTVKAGFRYKITTWMISPAALLAAFGIGVTMEQTVRHRGWSVETVVAAADASFRLLLSLPSPVKSVTENSTQASNHGFTRK